MVELCLSVDRKSMSLTFVHRCLAVVYLSHFSPGRCPLGQSLSVPEVSQGVKSRLELQCGGSYLEISDLKTVMLLERIVTTCIGLLRKQLMW